MEHESRSTTIPMFVQITDKSSRQYARDRSARDCGIHDLFNCSIFFVVSSCSKHEVCYVKAQIIWNLQTWLCLHYTPEVCMVSGSKRSQKRRGQFQVCRCTGRDSQWTDMQTEASVIAVMVWHEDWVIQKLARGWLWGPRWQLMAEKVILIWEPQWTKSSPCSSAWAAWLRRSFWKVLKLFKLTEFTYTFIF